MRKVALAGMIVAFSLTCADRSPSSPPSVVAPTIACGALGAVTHGNLEMLVFDQLLRGDGASQADFNMQIRIWRPARWDKNTTLKVRFLDSPPKGLDVMKLASEWTQDLTVKFVLVVAEPSDVRVTFAGGGLASRIGAEAKSIGADQPTMSLGGLSESKDENERRAFVLHEFGHALGALHEHQRPDAPLTWNTDAVRKYFRNHYRMSDADVDKHVIAPMQQADLVGSPDFDRNSVMMYAILKEFTKEGFVQPWNGVLTEWDRKIVRQLYGQ